MLTSEAMKNTADELYLDHHRDAIENGLTAALNACLEAQPSSPNLFLASHFAAQVHADGLPRANRGIPIRGVETDRG